MNATESYLDAANAYADGVRVLFAPSGQDAGERGGKGPISYNTLADQAEALAPLSANLIAEAAGRLAEATPAERIDLETALLAKSLADLEICGYLLQAAQDQQGEIGWEPEPGRGEERSLGSRRIAEPYLQLVLGAAMPGAAGPERGTLPKTIDEARVDLMLQSGDALKLISARAVDTSKEALEGLVSIGLDEVGTAIGVVGLDIAEALGKVEEVTRLYKAFRDFLQRAYDSLMAMLSPKIAEFLAERVKEWFEKFTSGELVEELLEKLYKTTKTKDELRPTIMGSPAGLKKYHTALEKVNGLNEAYRKQTGLVDKILPKIKYVTLIPAAKLPQAKAIVAAVYVLMGGYVIYLGADYVDAPPLERFNRIPGVRVEVETNLAVP